MTLEWSWLDTFSAGGGFQNLLELENINLENYHERDLELGIKNGKLHALPVAMTGRVFYYNQAVWEDAGIDYPTTWDELYEAGNHFKEKYNGEKYPLALDHDMFMTIMMAYMCKNIISH